MIATHSLGSIGSEHSFSTHDLEAQATLRHPFEAARDRWDDARGDRHRSRSPSPRRATLSRTLTSASSTPSEVAGMWSRTMSSSASPRAGDGSIAERWLSLSPNRAVAQLMSEPGAAQALIACDVREVAGAGGWPCGGVEMLVAAAQNGDLARFRALCAQHRGHIAELACARDAWLVRTATRAGPSYARELLTHFDLCEWHPLLSQDGSRGFRNLLRHHDAELVTSLCLATADGPMRALLESASAEVRVALSGSELGVVLRAVMARLGMHVPGPPGPAPGGRLPEVEG